jgi:transmembrane sensor
MTVQDEDRIAAEAARWQARLSGGAADARDLADFAAWQAADPRHAAAAAEMAALWRAAGPPARPRRRLARRALAAGGAAAAAAAGFAILPRRIEAWGADAVTAIGERREVSLPGGWQALLNTDTVLRIEAPDHLALPRGEALFAGPPEGSALLVATAGLLVRAVGANFAVAADGPRRGVQVAAGLVQAGASAAAALVPVRAGQRLRDGAARPETADPLDLAWRQGVLAFRQRRLASVAEELDRYRQGRIVIPSAALRARTVSGSLSLDRPDAAVAALAELFGLSARFLPGGLVFLGEG